MITIAATGHRGDKLGDMWLPYDREDVLVRLMGDFIRRAEQEPLTIISGMALGWDLLVAGAAIKARDRGAPIAVHAYIPFKGQDLRWNERSRATYHEIRNRCDAERIISPGDYSFYKMQLRNMAMVDAADLVLACWNGTPGGTSNCIWYAERTGVRVVNVYQHYFPELVERQLEEVLPR
jgi:uncharacterized phage-like protein YoqJ